MKRLSLIALSLVLTGAGCFGGNSLGQADAGVFQTVNAGEDWGQKVIVPTASGIGTLATTDVINMTMDPQDKNYLYIGTRQSGLLYSEDGGTSWRQPRTAALAEGAILNVAVDPTDVCTAYVAKGPRLYRTQDCMRSFDSERYVDNRAGVSVVQVEVDWFTPTTVWIGLSNGDVLKSRDSGKNWSTVLKTANEISGFLINKSNAQQVLVSTFQNGVYKTIDGGANWEEVDGGLRDLKQSKRVFQMTQSANSGVVVMATQYGLVRSTDFGDTWSAIALLTSPGQVLIRVVAMDQNNPNILYYASNATFYRSADAGATWSTDRFPSSRVPRAMVVDPDDSSVVYIGVATATE